MHEGSADAIAERALTQLGVISPSELADYETAALNSCALGIAANGVRSAAKRSSALYYSCGNLIALLTERSLPANKDLLDFWKSLIARARSGGGSYSADDYMSVMKEIGASARAIDDVRLIIDKGADVATIEGMLGSRSIPYVTVDNPPPSYGQTLSRQATLALLGEWCPGRHGFRAERSGFILDSGITCKGIPAGATITHIGGKDVLREGHLVWDYLHNTCAPSGSVAVTVKTADSQPSELQLPCSKPVTSRPPYIQIIDRIA
jgi:hypothetical protein